MIKTYGYSPTTLRFQYGVKFAISGVLTLYCVCWLRLDTPAWSLSTVAVLMVAQYVGGIAEKAFFRLCGTIIGALLGVALVGNFLGNGPLFLTLLFVLLTFFNYMFGGKRAPSAFFVCSMTMLVVIGGSIFSPEKAWNIGMSRTLNISLGIIVTLVVSTVLWPRHARVEFHCLAMAMLHRLEETIQEIEKSLYQRSSNLVRLDEIEANHVKNIELLQRLMYFGAHESSAFALRIPSYNIIVDRLSRIHTVSIELAQGRHLNSLFVKKVKPEVNALLSAIENECALFRESLTKHVPPRPGTLKSACKALIYHIDTLRSAQIHFKNEAAEFVAFAGFATGFLESATHLHAIREELVRLFISARYQPAPSAKKRALFAIDPDRMVPALKGSITGVLAVVFCDWMHPPGFELIPVSASLFIMLSHTYFYGNKGQKALRYAFLGGLLGIPALILFTLLTPWIANYFYMNIFILVSFFLFGWAYFEYLGIVTQFMLALIFAITGVVNVCHNWPPAPSSFQNWYFGIVIAMGFCALVQRLLWPPLPQNKFFSACQHYFSECLHLLANVFSKAECASHSVIFQTVWNIDRWVDVLPLRACVPQERQKLHEFLSQMRFTGYQIAMLKDAIHYEETHVFFSQFSPILAPLKETLHLDLNECQQAFKDRRMFPLPSPPRPSPTERFHVVYKNLREQALLKSQSTPVVMEVLGTLHRLETAAYAAWNCRQLVSCLQFENYADDVAL